MCKNIFSLVIIIVLFTTVCSSQLNNIWITSFNDTAAGRDNSTASAIDSKGNIYVVGYTQPWGNYFDGVIIKYDSNGAMQWKDAIDGDEHLNDYTYGVTTDSMDNVYIVNKVNYGSNVNSDIQINSYSPEGTLRWNIKYVHNGYELGSGRIIVNAKGECYLLGYKHNNDSSKVFLLKLSTTGQRVWEDSLCYSGKGYFDTGDLQLHANGDISFCTFYDSVYGAMKGIVATYSSDGTQKWISESSPDYYPKSITYEKLHFDNNNNIYVAGQFENQFFATKYTPTGDTIWTSKFSINESTYHYFGDYTVDKDGTSFLAGNLQPNDGNLNQCFITSWDSNGVYKWKVVYDSPFNGNEGYRAISVNNENIFAAGYASDSSGEWNIITGIYNKAGTMLGTEVFDDSGFGYGYTSSLIATQSGKFILNGTSSGLGTGEDIVTMQFNEYGNRDWFTRYTSYVSARQYVNASTIDDSGNIYLAGSFYTGARENDDNYLIVKINSSGNMVWNKAYGGDSLYSSNDDATDIAVDKNGNVYVSGTFSSTSIFKKEFGTLKFNKDGELLWERRFSGPNKHHEGGDVKLRLDNTGNVLVGGTLVWDSLNTEIVCVKYNPDGDELWASHFDGGYRQDIFERMVTDDSGNVYVTGYGQGGIANYDILTMKFSGTDGHIEWVQRYNNYANLNDFPNDIGLDSHGNILVTGVQEIRQLNNPVEKTAIILKYSSSGNELWRYQYPEDSTSFRNSRGYKLFVDELDNIVVGVASYHTNDNSINLLKLDANGTKEWFSETNILESHVIQSIRKSKHNEYYVLATEWNTVSESKPIIVKYSHDGTLRWETEYQGVRSHEHLNLFLDSLSHLIIAGTELSEGLNSNFFAAKFSDNTLGLSSDVETTQKHFSLANAFPNPFNPVTVIQYSVPSSQYISLKVFNMLGQEVATLVNEVQETGYKSVEFNADNLPSGIYFYRLTATPVGKGNASAFTDVKKMILVR